MIWKNCTSYSQGDKDRTPRMFDSKAGNLRMVVMNDHMYFRGEWVATVFPLFDTARLGDVKTPEEAQAKCEEITKRWLTDALRAIEAN